MSGLLISPIIGSETNPNVITLPAKEVQLLYSDKFSLSTMNWYQDKFNIFRKMTITRARNFRLHKLSTSGSMWQKWDACTSIPFTGGGTSSTEVPSYMLQFLIEWCIDELLGTCFESEITFENNTPELTEVGEQLFNQFLMEKMEEVNRWLMLTAFFGDLYPEDIELNTDLGYTENAQFRLGANAAKGVFAVWKQSAAKYPWLDLGSKNELKFGNCGFEGSVRELIEMKKCEAHENLRNLLSTGSAGRSMTSNRQCNVFIIATPEFFPAIEREYKEQQDNTHFFDSATACITKEKYGENINDYYWTIDSMPVIPLNESLVWDKQIAGKTHFIGITVSENLQIGSNFGSQLGQQNSDIGMLFAQNTDPASNEYMKVRGRGYAILSTAIADPTLAVGCFYHQESKK